MLYDTRTSTVLPGVLWGCPGNRDGKVTAGRGETHKTCVRQNATPAPGARCRCRGRRRIAGALGGEGDQWE